MGFMDKAKKMAEQAQAKLDDAQKQFNSPPSGQTSGPVVEYDEHGRPIAQAPPETAAAPHGDPLAGIEGETSAPPDTGAPPPLSEPQVPTPGVPPTASGDPTAASAPPPSAPQAGEAPAPHAPPARPETDAPDEDRNHPSYAPPKLSSGDPLAG
jgi:hypothetical protein